MLYIISLYLKLYYNTFKNLLFSNENTIKNLTVTNLAIPEVPDHCHWIASYQLIHYKDKLIVTHFPYV